MEPSRKYTPHKGRVIMQPRGEACRELARDLKRDAGEEGLSDGHSSYREYLPDGGRTLLQRCQDLTNAHYQARLSGACPMPYHQRPAGPRRR